MDVLTHGIMEHMTTRVSGKLCMSIEKTIRQVLTVLDQYRFVYSNEKQLQQSIYDVLADEGVSIDRERSLAPFGVVDFMKDGVAFEIKIKGQKKNIYRQCRDYCKHEDVKALVLVTANAMGLPENMEGKPSFVYRLSGKM